MSLALSSLLLLAAAEIEFPVPVLLPPEEAVRRLEACGLVDVAAHYDELVQDNVLLVRDVASADEALACAANVSATTGYWIEVPESSRAAYFSHYATISRQRSREWARAHLARQGLLETAPAYVAGETDDRVFAGRLEGLCGAAATGAFQSEYGPHTLSPAWIASWDTTTKGPGEVLACLMTYAAAAEYELGFIGNEKAAASD
jgi:hypothetical protein